MARRPTRLDTVIGLILSKSAIPLATSPCYDWIPDVPRFDRESSGGQSAYRERKGQPEMDLRRKQTRSYACRTAIPRIELNGEYDLSSKDDIASLLRSRFKQHPKMESRRAARHFRRDTRDAFWSVRRLRCAAVAILVGRGEHI